MEEKNERLTHSYTFNQEDDQNKNLQTPLLVNHYRNVSDMKPYLIGVERVEHSPKTAFSTDTKTNFDNSKIESLRIKIILLATEIERLTFMLSEENKVASVTDKKLNRPPKKLTIETEQLSKSPVPPIQGSILKIPPPTPETIKCLLAEISSLKESQKRFQGELKAVFNKGKSNLEERLISSELTIESLRLELKQSAKELENSSSLINSLTLKSAQLETETKKKMMLEEEFLFMSKENDRLLEIIEEMKIQNNQRSNYQSKKDLSIIEELTGDNLKNKNIQMDRTEIEKELQSLKKILDIQIDVNTKLDQRLEYTQDNFISILKSKVLIILEDNKRCGLRIDELISELGNVVRERDYLREKLLKTSISITTNDKRTASPNKSARSEEAKKSSPSSHSKIKSVVNSELKALQVQMDRILEEKEIAKLQVDELQKILDEKDMKIVDLVEQVNSNKSEHTKSNLDVVSMRKIYFEREKQLEKLIDQYELLQNQRNEEVTNLHNQLLASSRQIEDLQDEMVFGQQMTKTFKDRISELEVQIESYELSTQRLSSIIESKDIRISQIIQDSSQKDTRIHQQQSTISSLQYELSSQKEIIKQQQLFVSSAEATREELESNNEKIQVELFSAKESISYYEKTTQIQKTELDSKDQLISTLNLRLGFQSNKLNEVASKITSFTSSIAIFKSSTETVLQSLLTRLAKLRSVKFSSIFKKLRKRQKQASLARSEIDTLSSIVKNLRRGENDQEKHVLKKELRELRVAYRTLCTIKGVPGCEKCSTER